LELSEEEKEWRTAQVYPTLGYFDKLYQLGTSRVEPTTTVKPKVSVIREGEVRPSLKQGDALANAPDRKDIFFQVMRIIQD